MEQYGITPEGLHTLIASNQDVLLFDVRLAPRRRLCCAVRAERYGLRLNLIHHRAFKSRELDANLVWTGRQRGHAEVSR